MKRALAAATAVWVAIGHPGFAQETLTEAKASFIFNGERIKIRPDTAVANRYVTRFTDLESPCSPACIAPMLAAPNVETLDENAVLTFLVNVVGKNGGLVLDARMPDGRATGYIPGSVSLPHATMAPDNAYRSEILKALGARVFDDLYNFADAKSLVVYDNGPVQNDAGTLINYLLEAGYPAEKVKYYRGGMQVWSVLGLSIEEGRS